MRTMRIIFVGIMLATALLGYSQPVSAGSATHYSVHINNVTIPWVFPPPEGLSSLCPLIPEGVHINPDDFGSDRVKNVIENELPGGGKKVLWTDLIKGTATDNFGETYTFIYVNNTTFDFDGEIVNVEMKDTFKLNGGSVSYTVGFNWRWAYPTDSLEIVVVEENGQIVDVFPDPIFGPTLDGVNEDPSIVPGSWQQISTRGAPQPLDCDPL